MRNTLVTLLGPTGIGKTDLATHLALYFGSEIISADSRQFYREMRIGTAVPSDDQLSKVRHHFIRFISVADYYSASLFERDVLDLLPSLFKKNRIVIMCGGSGLYIDAVLKGIDDIPDTDPTVRDKYNDLFRKEGIESLRMALKMMDPDHYRKVDLRNPKRLIRALEICETTGKPYSSFLGKKNPVRDFRIIKIGLEMPREDLYRRINERVDRMVSEGLEEEVRGLEEFRSLNALRSVGYREFFDYFDGKISRTEAIGLIKRNSRRFARRQITWWSKDNEIKWFH
ncbi:MAG: tRNA (adenosine(37)-N6)-dimethylallyltransferase MiaA, partial [Bacteroidales bacterium]|nr:tRNA (adenosine(37)-N6)-dimethylallyltransferase MiaA [Bacteroidales bacterium]